jgi:uncharacterized membrane protein
MNRGSSLLIPLLICFHGSAFADLEFCNYTKAEISLALHWQKDGAWVYDGWWNLQPSECKVPAGLGGSLRNRYYYYYALRADGTSWGDGENSINGCIDPASKFAYSQCPADAKRVKYRTLDTGEAVTHTLRFTHPGEPFNAADSSDREMACDLLNRNLDRPRLRSEKIVLGSYTDPLTLPQTRSECTNVYDTGVPDPSTCGTKCVQTWRTDFPKASGCMRWETRCTNVKACNTWKVEKKTMQCDLVFQIKLPSYVERPLSDFIDGSYSIAENMRAYAKTSLPLQCSPSAPSGAGGDLTSEIAHQIADQLRERVRQTIEREARQWLQETAIETIAASIPSGGAGGAAIMSTKLVQFAHRTQKALKPIIKIANETKEFAEDLGFSTSCGWSDWHRF